MGELLKRSFFDIHQQLIALMGEIEQADGEMTDQQEIALSELQIEVHEKVLGVAAWFKNLQMEEASAELLYKEVKESLAKNRAMQERLKNWIFKAALASGFITGNSKDGWEGRKMANGQITLSWRRSEGVVEKPDAQGYSDLPNNFPSIFRHTITCTEAGGRMLMDMVEAGDVTIKESELSKTMAGELLEKMGGVGISGISIEKRINPTIKAA